MNQQEEAIKKEKGPCVILAGAGTGKTYTIVEKIKYLIGSKIYSPERIVCITFSNEAANNLASRIRNIIDFDNEKEPVIKTFHSFSAELLRKYGEKIGINKEFNILTPDEAKVVLHKYLKVSVGNCHKYISAIGMAKDLGISLDEFGKYLDKKLVEFNEIEMDKRLENLKFELQTLYLRSDKWKKKQITTEIKKINNVLNLKKFFNTWNAYEKIKKIKNYQDYSDLNKSFLRLLKEHKEVAHDYDYIIVDEFQDTNKLQLDLLFYLAGHGNITVVGDLNQSIYRFRGAYNKNFNEFRNRFNVSKNDIFNLDKSYRSSNKILRSAHNLILNNYANKDECFEVLNFDNREGDNIENFELKNAKEEARKVTEIIEREIERGVEFNEICIMFRTHQQGRLIKKALELVGIPFTSVNKISLLKEKSIKTVINYLTILKKIKNNESGGEHVWWDLIYQLDFAEQDLINIGKFIKDNKAAENLSMLMLSSLPDLKLSPSGTMAVKILVERIKLLIPETDKEVPLLIKTIYNFIGLINEQTTKEEKIVMLNLNRFFDLVKEHSTMHMDDLNSFIGYIEILDNLGIEIEAADSEDKGVRLMTLHATKGLEYKTVIITNMAQKRFPIERYNSNSLIPIELSPEFDHINLSDEDLDYYIYEYERQNQLFEERRLCYVAFTRAKERLILTYAREYAGKRFYPSQFLEEINYTRNSDSSFFVDEEEKYNELETKSDKFSKSTDSDRKETDNLFINKNRVSNDITFSPSGLLTFANCQKKYEYKYIYNMPDQKTISWEAMMLGSFVHRVLEAGVKNNLTNLREFENLARELHVEIDWEDVDLSEAMHLIRVFFERNKSKYDQNSKTEQKLNIELGGIRFTGFADRIDFCSDGLEIIDYKTGNTNVPVLARNWQLGYYALAASKFGKVKKITLDMLKHDTPLEFELDDKGNAIPLNSSRLEGFNIYSVEGELIKTAHDVLQAYEKGFRPCSIEKNCEFCNEWVWKL